MGSDDLRVPKEMIRVHVRLRGEGHFEGDVFLSGCSPIHDGPQGLVELLNEPEPFFPIRLPGSEVRLVGKHEVIVVALPRPAAERYGGIRDYPTWQPARLVLVDDRTLQGDLNISASEIRYPRVLDALNAPGRFVCLRDEHALHVVNKNAVRWVVAAAKPAGEVIAHEEITHG
jgi:hypothetical protein